MEFSGRCHSTTGGITSSTLLPFGLWAPGLIQVQILISRVLLIMSTVCLTDSMGTVDMSPICCKI